MNRGKPPPVEAPKDEAPEDEVEELEGWKMEESQALPLLIGTNEEFMTDWALRTDQILDPKGRLIFDLMRDPLYHKLQLEMREAADELIRPEMEELRQALMLDHAEDENKFALPLPQVFGGSFAFRNASFTCCTLFTLRGHPILVNGMKEQ